MIFKFLITFFLIFYSSSSFSKKIIEGKAKIIDGDTIHIGKNKIRLHGIDAPETNQVCTINSKEWIEFFKTLRNNPPTICKYICNKPFTIKEAMTVF